MGSPSPSRAALSDQGRIQEGGPLRSRLKCKVIYISGQRNSGNKTSEDAITFFFYSISGGELDEERREDLFFGLHRYFQWKRKQETVSIRPYAGAKSRFLVSNRVFVIAGIKEKEYLA